MDKEQAIKILERHSEYIVSGSLLEQALSMAIKELKTQLLREDTTKDTTSDTISRKAAIDALNGYFARIGKLKRRGLTEGEKAISLDTVGAIKTLPPVQPERAAGEWLPDNNYAYEMRFVCSCCKESEVVPTIGFTKYKPIWDFCPNCGAKMRGEKDG